MGLTVIPAIDIKSGKCVRLRQGHMHEETVFSEDPVAMALRWADAGARRMHIVDLDGAVIGTPVNAPIIEAIAQHLPDLRIQVGGGIRDAETVQAYLNAGVSYVILGTKAVTAPQFVREACAAFAGHIIVGLDAKEGRIAVSGWSRVSDRDVIGLAKEYQHHDVDTFIYTDISRDGMLTGPNVEATVKLAQATSVPVIASGGITNLADVRKLCDVADAGIIGAITGRALYEGTLDLTEAQELADELTGSEE